MNSPNSDHLAQPSDKGRTGHTPTAWAMPHAPELLAFINSTPVVMSLLYDINLLPEQIDNYQRWDYMVSVCEHMKTALNHDEHRVERAMADEYQAWIDHWHGGGDYDGFLKLRLAVNL